MGNYDYFSEMLTEKWVPAKSPSGNDQWRTSSDKHVHTMRLTADLALVNDDIYKKIVMEYASDHKKFDSDFADAWYKLVHRSEDHPHEDDLEKDVGFCTHFEFLDEQPDQAISSPQPAQAIPSLAVGRHASSLAVGLALGLAACN